jgi:hypothetical protein
VKENEEYARHNHAGSEAAGLETFLSFLENNFSSENKRIKNEFSSNVQSMRTQLKNIIKKSYHNQHFNLYKFMPDIRRLGDIYVKKIETENPEEFEELVEHAKKYSNMSNKKESARRYLHTRFVETAIFRTHNQDLNGVFISYGSKDVEKLFSNIPTFFMKGFTHFKCTPWFNDLLGEDSYRLENETMQQMAHVFSKFHPDLIKKEIFERFQVALDKSVKERNNKLFKRFM